MRIAIVNWSSRRAGGVEAYLDRVIGGLHSAGHETAFFCELDSPVSRQAIRVPAETPLWCASEIGNQAAISALRNWRPDIIYAHGLMDPALEAATLGIAPGVFFAHSYRGTCISGAKTFKFPAVRPCSRQFGWQCLMHFYPRRCGGLNPITMLNDFRLQSRRLSMLRSYCAIATASEYMREEYLRHGFASETVTVIPLPIEPSMECHVHEPNREQGLPFKLLFVGRMEALKGGLVLLDALPMVCGTIKRPIQMTFVGDGRERSRWAAKAARITANEPALKIEFTGWQEGAKLNQIVCSSDLLVMPSLWPEPFGLVGPEAAVRGIPAVAFNVGGISDWLFDGVNGRLAPGDPPTAHGLAQVLIECLRFEVHDRLRQGGLELAQRFNIANHISQVVELFDKVSGALPASRVGACSPESGVPDSVLPAWNHSVPE